jgi:hypothetical protein
VGESWEVCLDDPWCLFGLVATLREEGEFGILYFCYDGRCELGRVVP